MWWVKKNSDSWLLRLCFCLWKVNEHTQTHPATVISSYRKTNACIYRDSFKGKFSQKRTFGHYLHTPVLL